MSFSDTIFALSTASGKAGVAIIRISGGKVRTALDALGVASPPPPRYARFTRFTNSEGAVLDEGLVLYFPAPHSFTGEDVAELHIHGSRATIRSVLDYLGALPDLRLAEPGEFSRRALAHHKLDFTQAEGLADLIDAETEAQQQLALRHMEGELSRVYEGWRQTLIEHMAYLEAFIDFPEEDIPPDRFQAMLHQVADLRNVMQAHLKNHAGRRIREGITVAIVGRPNVGKSSLLNCLAQKEAAIVSEEAGTTRDLIEIHMDIAGYPVVLVDTAGLRESDNPIEREGVKRARERAASADIVLYMIDADESLSAEIPPNAVVLYNKADQIPLPERLAAAYGQVLSVSAKTGHHIPQLLEALTRHISALMEVKDAPVMTRERHALLVAETVDHLERFLVSADNATPIELLAEDMRLAAVSLGKLTGAIDVEDMLDSLFSSFCIGK